MKVGETSLFTKTIAPVLTVALLALTGAAYASSGTSSDDAAAGKDKVDCKKTPNDPACKPKLR